MAAKKFLVVRHKRETLHNTYLNPDHIVDLTEAFDGGCWITTTNNEVYYSHLTVFDVRDELDWKFVGRI